MTQVREDSRDILLLHHNDDDDDGDNDDEHHEQQQQQQHEAATTTRSNSSTSSSTTSARSSSRRKQQRHPLSSSMYASTAALRRHQANNFGFQLCWGSSSSSKNNNSADGVTLYGRQDELERLGQCLAKCCSRKNSNNGNNNDDDALSSHDPTKALVLIGGSAGTGKTVLAKRALYKKTNKPPCTSASPGGSYGCFIGKCSQTTQIPYRPWIAALEEWGQQQQQHVKNDDNDDNNKKNDNQQVSIQSTLLEDLGPDVQLLITLLPFLADILHDDDPNNKNDSNDTFEGLLPPQDDSQESSRNRFQFALRRFFRILCRHQPMVFILDDFQWADEATLQLLQSLLTDKENSSLLIVATYRTDEVDANHGLSKLIATLQQQQQQDDNSCFELAQMTIGNLSVKQVNQMIAQLVSREPNETAPLADIVHAKTAGNALFVTHFLKSLQENHLLSYDLGKMTWTWNVQDIRQQTVATQNVVDLLRSKMAKQPAVVALQYIALLGSVVSLQLVTLVLGQLVVLRHDDGSTSTSSRRRETAAPPPLDQTVQDQVLLYLNTCVQEGFLESCGSMCYRWAHDKVQEAALSMTPTNEVARRQYQIGILLVDQMSAQDQKRNIFLIAELLTKGFSGDLPSEYNNRHEVEISEINMQAGTEAMSSSAFDCAAKYLDHGIQYLPPNHWALYPQLSLDLYSSAAQAHYACGNGEQAQRYCNLVVDRPDFSLLDKQRIYNVQLDCLGSRDTGKAVEMTLDLLSRLGCKLPRRCLAVHASAGILRTKVALRLQKPGALARLRVMTDPVNHWVMNLLERLIAACYILQRHDLLPLVILRMHRWTLRYGLGAYAAPTFAAVGTVLVGLNDYAGAAIFAKQSLALLNGETSSRIVESRTLLMAYALVLHWTTPVQSVKKYILRGHEAGMASGDISSASWNLFDFIEYSLLTGVALEAVSTDLKSAIGTMRELGQMVQSNLAAMLWQVVLNLQGKGENASMLSGWAMKKYRISAEFGLERIHAQRLSIILSFYFGEYERVVAIIEEAGGPGTMGRLIPGAFMTCPLMFHSALSCYRAARTQTQRGIEKCKHLGRLCKKIIQVWVHKKNPNVVHYLSLVKAESAALDNQVDVARQLYEKSIVQAGRRGITCDQALAHELFGEFCLDRGNTFDGQYHLEQSSRLYCEWGAWAKVRHLEAKHGHDLLASGDNFRHHQHDYAIS